MTAQSFKSLFILMLATATAVCAGISSATAASPLYGLRPNIVLIMPDDYSQERFDAAMRAMTWTGCRPRLLKR